MKIKTLILPVLPVYFPISVSIKVKYQNQKFGGLEMEDNFRNSDLHCDLEIVQGFYFLHVKFYIDI